MKHKPIAKLRADVARAAMRSFLIALAEPDSVQANKSYSNALNAEAKACAALAKREKGKK